MSISNLSECAIEAAFVLPIDVHQVGLVQMVLPANVQVDDLSVLHPDSDYMSSNACQTRAPSPSSRDLTWISTWCSVLNNAIEARVELSPKARVAEDSTRPHYTGTQRESRTETGNTLPTWLALELALVVDDDSVRVERNDFGAGIEQHREPDYHEGKQQEQSNIEASLDLRPSISDLKWHGCYRICGLQMA